MLGIPYIVVGGLRFYDRREIKDLRPSPPAGESGRHRQLVAGDQCAKTGHQQDHDSAPHRCGQSAGDSAVGRGGDPEAVRSLGGRSAKGLLQFCELVNDLKARSRDVPPSELIQQVMKRLRQ